MVRRTKDTPEDGQPTVSIKAIKKISEAYMRFRDEELIAINNCQPLKQVGIATPAVCVGGILREPATVTVRHDRYQFSFDQLVE